MATIKKSNVPLKRYNELVNVCKKYKTNTDILSKYTDNESSNYHIDNVVLMVIHFGTKEEIAIAKKVFITGVKKGYSENSPERKKIDLIANKYYYKLKESTGMMATTKPAKKMIDAKLSAKYNIGRYGNKGHYVEDGNKQVFVSNSSKDDDVNWLLALDFAKNYFKNQNKMTTAKKQTTVKAKTPAQKRKATLAKKNRQTGKTTVLADKSKIAKKPGKRISATGNVYYERRANRSDVNKLLGAKKPTEKQLAAQKGFKVNAAKARALVASGKAASLKEAWKKI